MSNKSTEQELTRIAVAQLDPALGDIEQNIETIIEVLSNPTGAHADIIIFPELFVTGYHIDGNARSLAEQAQSAVYDVLPYTTDHVLIIGCPVLDRDTIYNSALIIEDEEILGRYDKTHLYGIEPDTFSHGNQLPTFETSYGEIGVEICYDVEFPEVARQLTINGADLIVTISANMRPCDQEQDIYHRGRALENTRSHVLCNRVGEERGVDFFGKSGITDARGHEILSIGTDRSDVIAATVPRSRDAESLPDYWRDRRPELYDTSSNQ